MSHRSRGLAAFAAAVTAISVVACGAGGDSNPGGDTGRTGTATTKPSSGRSSGSHVFVLVLENREFGQVIGNPSAPFFNRLALRGALATRYFAITHPSLPNYLALLGGATFHIQSDCTSCTAKGPNLAQQLERAGVSWRAYMEGMPKPCYRGSGAGGYAKKHDPFMYFPSVRNDPASCSNVVPGSRLDADLAGGRLAAFSWITPDLCHDGHDCGTAAMDRYLAGIVPRLKSSLGPHGFLVVTFDEGVSERGCCAGAHGGRVATVFSGPDVRKHARLKREYDHYSLLRTLQNAFSLPPLRRSARVIGIPPAFTTPPSIR
jgi:phosphatidylinositol-3-phosphatase